MTQEKINKYFNTSLGQQVNELYSTPDDVVLIRYEEAKNHCEKNNLNIEGIQLWFPDDECYSDNKYYHPSKEQCFNSMNVTIEQLLKDHPEFQEENSTGNDLIATLNFIKDTFKDSFIANDEDLPF